MTQHNEWASDTAYAVSVSKKLLKLAEKRIDTLSKAVDELDSRLDKGDHPEMIFMYLMNLRGVLPTEELLDLTTIVSRLNRDIRLLTGAKYHDLNVIAQFLYGLGYRVTPANQVKVTETNKGLTSSQVKGIRQALNVEILGTKTE